MSTEIDQIIDHQTSAVRVEDDNLAGFRLARFAASNEEGVRSRSNENLENAAILPRVNLEDISQAQHRPETRQPDTPQNEARRPPDSVTEHRGAKREEWRYPDGTEEVRETFNGHYSLTRRDASGRRVMEVSIYDAPDKPNTTVLRIDRAIGAGNTTIVSTPIWGIQHAVRDVRRPDGTTTREELTPELAKSAFDTYRRIIMR